jgi:hypothetical protein
MEPISLVLAALLAGAAAGGQEVASSILTDAYKSLKRLVAKRLQKAARRSDESAIYTIAVLDAYEKGPESWDGPMRAMLVAAHVEEDADVLDSARALLEKADPDGAARGKYRVDVRGGQGVQIGDHGQMTVTFNESNGP